jgi:hypothetical protein
MPRPVIASGCRSFRSRGVQATGLGVPIAVPDRQERERACNVGLSFGVLRRDHRQ